MTIYVNVGEALSTMPDGIEVAKFTDKYGKSFIVIERNGIRYIQQVTLGKTQDGAHPPRGVQQSAESPRPINDRFNT